MLECGARVRTGRLQGAFLRALWRQQQLHVCSLAPPRSRPQGRIRSIRILLRKMPGMCKGREKTAGIHLGLVESNNHGACLIPLKGED